MGQYSYIVPVVEPALSGSTQTSDRNFRVPSKMTSIPNTLREHIYQNMRKSRNSLTVDR